MQDDKHIDKDYVKFFVANIKSKMRETNNIQGAQDSHRGSGRDNNRWSGPRFSAYQQQGNNNNVNINNNNNNNKYNYNNNNNNNNSSKNKYHYFNKINNSSTSFSPPPAANSSINTDHGMRVFHSFNQNDIQPLLRTTGQHQQWSESQDHSESGTQGDQVTVNTPTLEMNPKLQEHLKQMNSMIEANNSMVRNMMASMYTQHNTTQHNPMFQLPSSMVNLS